MYVSAIVASIAVAAVIVIKLPERWFFTEFKKTPRPKGFADTPPTPDPERDGVRFEELRFRSNAKKTMTCHCWLFTPTKELSLRDQRQRFPIVIMAHGIGGTKE